MTFSLPNGVNNKDSTHARFAWIVKSAATGTPTVAQGTSKTLEWTPATAGKYTVECTVKEGSAEVGTVSLASNLTVEAENYKPAFTDITVTNPSAIVVYGSSAQYTAPIPAPYLKSEKTGVQDVTTGFTVTYSSSNPSIASVAKASNSNSGVVTAGATAGTATITVTIKYQDKDYTETYTIYNRAPSYTIPTSIPPMTLPHSDCMQAMRLLRLVSLAPQPALPASAMLPLRATAP